MEFNFLYFLIGIIMGTLGVYVIEPEYKTVYKSPTEMNLENIYTDENGNCYSYEMKEVKCGKKYKNII